MLIRSRCSTIKMDCSEESVPLDQKVRTNGQSSHLPFWLTTIPPPSHLCCPQQRHHTAPGYTKQRACGGEKSAEAENRTTGENSACQKPNALTGGRTRVLRMPKTEQVNATTMLVLPRFPEAELLEEICSSGCFLRWIRAVGTDSAQLSPRFATFLTPWSYGQFTEATSGVAARHLTFRFFFL